MVIDKTEKAKSNTVTPKPLSAKQEKYLDLLFQRSDELFDDETLASQVGVKKQTVRGWLRNPNFQQAMSQRISERSESRMPKIWDSLLLLAEQGNVNAAKLVFELRGDLNEKDHKPDRIPPTTVNFVLHKADQNNDD